MTDEGGDYIAGRKNMYKDKQLRHRSCNQWTNGQTERQQKKKTSGVVVN